MLKKLVNGYIGGKRTPLHRVAAWLAIPRGVYCHNGPHTRTCPFWDISEEHEHQNNGYCLYMGEGDWENEYMSLLWDKCKECGVKVWWPWES